MDFLKYVNIKQGTNSYMRFSKGNTLPLVTLPFGMNNFCPQTMGSMLNWFYNPNHRQIEGIRLTHQPSPWMGDYGHFILMPQSGKPYITEELRSSGYRPEEAVLQPNYLKIDFLRYKAQLQLVPSERGALMRTHWYGDEIPRLAVIPFNYYTEIKLDVKNRLLKAFTKSYTGGANDKFGIYFVIHFNLDIDIKNTVITDNKNTCFSGLSGKGIGIGINIAFKKKSFQSLEARLGTSFISLEQALLNLNREIGNKDLNTLYIEGVNKWNNLLGKIDVEMNSQEDLMTFYSCLYRCFIFPRIFYEYDENNNILHHCTKDGSIKTGYMYTDNGFWDTFRTIYPLFSILIPDKLNEILQGFVNFYKEQGWLPRWLSPGERGLMPGTLIDAVIADSAVKGILKGETLENAFEGMLKHSTIPSNNSLNGRIGIAEYLKYGYVPRDLYKESVNNTLDSAYGDFCIAQVAKLLDKKHLALEYYKRSEYYKNVFDKVTLFSRGRDTKGRMKEDFNPFDWGGEYTEGSAWQNSYGVYHDIPGLYYLMGGRNRMMERMDELFSTPPIYNIGTYGFEIHEMTEMAAQDFGQCAISNQSSFHLPYIYSALDNHECTAYWIRRILSHAFNSSVDGFPGDEDNGSMSAWFVFSSLGFYPICPGKAEYVFGSPLVKNAVISFDNGKKTIITAPLNDDDHIYVKNVNVNGSTVKGTILEHHQITKGSIITFNMYNRDISH
jgi:predicted alpha-1,2-mannosidase